MPSYAGKVVALICAGTEEDRAVAIALAEAGADIALATIEPSQQQEFATASIANEVWAIGREQFSEVLDAGRTEAIAAFLDRVSTRLGQCDEVILSTAGVVPASLRAAITAALSTNESLVLRVLSGAPESGATPPAFIADLESL